MQRIVGMVCLLLISVWAPCGHAKERTCEQLAQLTLPNAQIADAQTIAAGTFTPPEAAEPWMRADASFYKQLPAFCRVTAVSKPTADSDIKIEVWLPATGWNAKFRGQGNGGFAGSIDYRALGWAIVQGYATAATDTGHAANGGDATWALNHPEKIIDFAHRAIHEMTVFGKATANAFYGEAPRKSYFASCSNGGRQALMEAQRYPDDYDGILAGAPANYFTHLLAGALWDAQATTNDPTSYIPSGKIPAIAQAVVAACDAIDGVKDGIVNDPRQCSFDPATILCKEGNSDACLTQPQVIALKKLYQGPYDSTGRQIFPGLEPGGELGPSGWPLWITGAAPGKALLFDFNHGYFADMVYGQAHWEYQHANLDDAVKASDQKFANVLNSTQSDMRAFAGRGGKLIIYHGWSDAAISPLNSISYYQSVAAEMGRPLTDSFLRLYMVPGMQHCDDGPGPHEFGAYGLSQLSDPQHNMYLALEQWVEKGTAPSTVIASKFAGEDHQHATMTRPLCVYPQAAKYKGSGDTNDATNFVCQK